jgi:Tfp pilus assembly protein PilN
MIRINLLGQARPKPAGRSIPVESTMQALFFVLAAVIAGGVLFSIYIHQTHEVDAVNHRIAELQAEKARLQTVKVQVDQFERQKTVLQQRINVIETLQKNRTGGQELLTMLADTVVRTDTLWLTDLARRGNSIQLQGEAGSITAVANFLTQMKRSGYFDKIEIKDTKENDVTPGVQTFSFEVSADIAGATPADTTPDSTPAPAPAQKPTGLRG